MIKIVRNIFSDEDELISKVKSIRSTLPSRYNRINNK